MKIAIVELSESHEECIYTQVRFLKDADYSVSLILHPLIRPEVKYYENEVDDVMFIDFDSASFLQKIGLQVKTVKRLKEFDAVIFNTASSSKSLRNIVLLLNFYKVKCIGVLHNVKKLEGSFTQSIISTKIKHYLVLNDFLLQSNTEKTKYRLESFYPIYFPEHKTGTLKPKDEIWICIPGRLHYDRRDYNYLIEKLSKNKLGKIKFILLGRLNKKSKEGILLLSALQTYDVLDSFILFSEFIPNALYYNYIKESDYIMPILNKDSDYLKYKISGSYNLAFAYQKKLLVHETFRPIPDFIENAVFYSDEGLEALLVSINEGSYRQKKGYLDPKWEYRYQQKKYVDFIKHAVRNSI